MFLGYGQILVKREFLAHVNDMYLYLLRLPHNGESGHGAGAGSRAAQAAQHAHGRGLACTVRPDEAEHGTFGNGKCHVVQRLGLSVMFGDALPPVP